MVNKLLKIEKVGKQLLRGGIALYLASIVFFTFGVPDSFGLANIQTGMIGILLIGIVFFLMLHYKNPRAGMIGGIGAVLFFLSSGVLVGFSDYAADASFSIIFLQTIKDFLLAFGAFVLLGESVKEMVREKITKPFPKR